MVRAVALLEALGRSDGHAGVTELARATGLSKATAFRLLGALEQTGMILRDAVAGTYRLGPATIALGATALRAVDLRAAARDELARLVARTGETATLEILVGDEMVIVDEVQGRFLLGSAPEIGTRWPVHATSTGKVMLAETRPDLGGTRRGAGDVGRAAHRLPRLERRTARTITSAGRLARELARVRGQGYATAVEELEPGFAAVAAPVYGHDRRAVAALSIGGPTSRLRGRHLTDLALAVRAAANRVSRQLGAPSGAAAPGCAPGRQAHEPPPVSAPAPARVAARRRTKMAAGAGVAGP